MPVHDILALIAYALAPPLNARAYVSSGTIDLRLGPSLHPYLYFVYASNEGSGEYAHVRRLAPAFAARK